MATKNCPHCSKQVPVACKKCVCGHTFFTKRGAGGTHKKEQSIGTTRDRERETSKGSSSSSTRQKSPGSDEEQQVSELQLPKPSSTNSSPSSKSLKLDDGDNPPRRTGRIQREKPNFYDSLEYDRQIKKQKTQVRRGRPRLDDSISKLNTSGGDNSGSGNGSFDEGPVKVLVPTVIASATTSSAKSDEQEPVKRRRGRPPRITTGDIKRGQVATRARIAINNKAKETSSRGAMMKDGKTNDEMNDDMMKDVSPEQAAQFNIILEEINRKWVQNIVFVLIEGSEERG